MMRNISLFLICFMLVGSWLASGVALAAGQAGGLPRCKTELAVCTDELVTCQATVQTFPATGQTSCWDTLGNPIDCASTGHDGDIQAGADLSYTDTGLTIIDNNTKLEWMKQDDNNLLDPLACDSLPGSLDKDCQFKWFDEFGDDAFAFVASLNAANHAGHADWRVPNVKELQSIVNYEKASPAVSTEFTDGCVAGCVVADCSCTYEGDYWSSTNFANVPGTVWAVFFSDGLVSNTHPNNYTRVRAVRGGL
jgi:hypothetical protein